MGPRRGLAAAGTGVKLWDESSIGRREGRSEETHLPW